MLRAAEPRKLPRQLLGVERTRLWLDCAVANDPQRTSGGKDNGSVRPFECVTPYTCPVILICYILRPYRDTRSGAAHETTRVHHIRQRRGYRLAARCTVATADNAGSWASQR